MDINDVLALAKAGFSRDEISKIALAVPAEKQTPATVPAQTPATVPAQTPATVPQQTPVTVPQQTPVTVPQQTPVTVPQQTPADAILKELGLIKDTMQANALFGAQMPKPESTEDILASIINPPEIKK